MTTVLKRDLKQLSTGTFDLLVIGGGIFGVCAVWEAAIRGLRVALVEKADFSHATSANHFKMIHGGIRYLQHGDIPRLRASCRERSALLRIAPHMNRPLPIVIPTYGWGTKSKLFLKPGILLYDLLTSDRNRDMPPECRVPPGRLVSHRFVTTHFPQLHREGLTGGALIHDGQMYNPPRLAVAFLRSAVERGAVVANYLEATGIECENNRVTGMAAHDRLTGGGLMIRARSVLNTSGPWAHRLLANAANVRMKPEPTFSRDLALVVNRRPAHRLSLAFATASQDSDALLDRGGRHLFMAPWRGYTLIGVWHKIFRGAPEEITVTHDELRQYLAEVNAAFNGLNLQPDEVSVVNTGMTLFGDADKQSDGLSFGKRSRIVDHGREHRLKGLFSLIGVRATMARGMAVQAIDRIFKFVERPPVASTSETSRLFGGDYPSERELVRSAVQDTGHRLDENELAALLRNHGSRYDRVLAYAEDDPQLWDPITGHGVVKAEIEHAIQEEMAQTLADVVLRRTDLGSGGLPDDQALLSCAEIMAGHKGWNRDQIASEIADVKSHYPHFSLRLKPSN